MNVLIHMPQTLFDVPFKPKNILPYDGKAIYPGKIFGCATADKYFEELLLLTPWKQDELVLYGKYYTTARKVIWYGETSYTYSGKTHFGLPWTKELLEIKKKVEQLEKTSYNSCLLNLYESGETGLGWHNDKEAIGPESNIASVSFGAERRFDFRHMSTKETVSVILEHGSLLVMKGSIQSHWRHHLPKTKKVKGHRINLTFRKIGNG